MALEFNRMPIFDTTAAINSDKVFLERLQVRVDKVRAGQVRSEDRRVWITWPELLKLRKLSGINPGTAHFKKKNRRIRLKTFDEHLRKAMENLAMRSGRLVAEQLTGQPIISLDVGARDDIAMSYAQFQKFFRV